VPNRPPHPPLLQQPVNHDAEEGGGDPAPSSVGPPIPELRGGADLVALLTALSGALTAIASAQSSDPSVRPLADAVHPLDAQDVPRGRRSTSHARIGTRAAELLKLDEVYAELGGIARSTFHDWRAKGKAPRCIKLPNGDLRVRRSELERWLNEREDTA
jgi:predicted DNA-binding transcriptional regulator AlpA